MDIAGIVALVVLAAAFGGALFWLGRQNQASRAALAALAAGRGWQVSETLPLMGKGTIIAVQPGHGESWSLVATRLQSDTGSGELRKIEWIDPGVARGGTVAIGPGMEAEMGAMAGQMLASLDSPMGQKLLQNVFGDDAGKLAGLRPLRGDPAGLTVFASQGAETGLDLVAVENAMKAWGKGRSGKLAQPIVILGAEGLRVRLRDIPGDPETIGAFVELALGVRKAIR